MDKLLKLKAIQKYYGNRGTVTKAIDDISFEVDEGEFVGIMGASGSGKTTLLNCIATIDQVSAGHIFLDGMDITEQKEKNLAAFRRQKLGFIFQDYNLLDTLTLGENIAMAQTINKVPANQIEQNVCVIANKLNIADILEFAADPGEETLALMEHQLKLNLGIAREGMEHRYGAQVGRTLLRDVKKLNPDTARAAAKAYAAAGSDARMNGCAMPVVINSGSGNQGLTVSLPVKIYADAYGISKERMLRSLVVSNLIAIHQKQYIGSLSAYCGAVSAACGAGAAIAYLLGEKLPMKELYRQVADTITNTIGTVGGMVCDGAKSSCAAKIATAVDCAITAYDLSRFGNVFQPGEGLVMESVEDTIESVGRMGREGMHATDIEILQIMLREE